MINSSGIDKTKSQMRIQYGVVFWKRMSFSESLWNRKRGIIEAWGHVGDGS